VAGNSAVILSAWVGTGMIMTDKMMELALKLADFTTKQRKSYAN
jgi:hypothetical protein